MIQTPEMQLDPGVVEILSQVTTATLTTILLKKGLRNVWLRGHPPFGHSGAQNVAKNASVGDPHGVDNSNAAGRHSLNSGPA